MSGDVQPRKRKDKKKKKDAADDIQSHFSSEEIMHSHKDVGTGGNICTKVIFYTLLGALLVMIGIILLDQRGITDLDSSDGDSQWAPIFQGWLEDSPSHEDEHLKTADSGEEEHEDHEHDSGIEDENDDEGDEHDEHDEERDEEENEEDHSGGGDEDDEGLDDDEELDEDEEQDGKEDESNQEIDEMQDDEDDNEDSKDEDEEYEGDKSDNEDENDEDEIEESNDDGLEDDNSQEEDYKSQEEDDKSQEEEEDEEEEQGHDDDDDDIEDNILFREIPGVVESTEDIEEGNASEEDLNESSEDKKDDAIASGEKIDDQVRNMADRTSGSPTKYNANTVNTEHVTLQNDDKKVDSEFNKPIEDSKKKESVDASMEKSQTLSKNKETAKQNSREKTEAQIQKEDLNKLADSIKATAKDVTSEKSKSETNIISEKVSDNMKEGSQRREANELNINSEKPLKGTDNNKMEQHITEENNQKVSEMAKAIKSPEKDKVKEVEKQSINQLNNIPEKPLRETGSHQKEQDVRQQKYEKVNEEAKVMKSFENKLPEKDKVKEVEKRSINQLNSMPEKPLRGTGSHQKEQDVQQQIYEKVNEEAKAMKSSENKLPEKDRVKEVEKQSINQLNNMPEKPLRETGSHQKKQDVQQQNYDQVNDEKKPSETKVVGKAEKQPIDQKKRDGANTNSFSRKPDSNEKEIRGNKAEKESRKVDDKSSTEHISNDKIDQPQKGNVKSDQKPISDNLQVGNVNKNEETVAQHHPEINDLKGEGQTTGLKLDKQDQKAEKAVNHDIEKMGSNYAKTSSDKMELNVEKTVRQNSEKISEHSHNDKSNKIKIEIDKPTDNKRDDSQQGKVSSSASDKAMGAETVKRTVSSQVPDKSQLTPKQNLEPDETEDKDENGDSGIEAEESDTTGVALKFGVGVALVIVAHVVLVRKWNSDDDMVPPQTPTGPSPRISVDVPRIIETSPKEEDVVEDEKNITINPEFVVRRQTLLPEELAQSFESRKREDSASSGGTEEDIEDDGQEARIFKMNVLSAELPAKEDRSFKDEKPFKEDRMYKLESFEELMKKYRQLTPEGSDLEYEDEEEEDGGELDEEEVDDEEEEEDLEDEEESLPVETLPGKKVSDHESNSEEDEEEDYGDEEEEKKIKHEHEDDESVEEEEEDDEEDEEDEDDPQLTKQEGKQRPFYSKYQQNISDEEDTDERPAPSLSKLSKGPGGEKAQNYVNYDITNDDDWNLIDELDKAAAEKAEVALSKFDLILKSYPNSPRAWYGKATALDQLAELHQSNHILEQAIEAFKKVVALGPTVKDKLLLQAAERCIERMRFKGQHMSAVAVHQVLISRFPNVSKYQNQLAVTYLMINRIQEAKRVLEKVLQHWKNDGFAQVHYGFILKTSGNNLEEAVKYLRNGIATREPGTIDGRFFFQLGDALHRLGRKDEAMKIYEMGVQEKLFLSKYQRSLYNVDRLHAQPWWTPEETTYTHLFNTLKNKWSEIRREGLAALYEKDINLFQDESENLKDSGKWQQLELYARGRKIQKNCLKAPLTCQLIDAFPMARDCKRGQVKFSVMHAGTHVWPHCGPTNCRLRSHLGLVVPSGTFIRVADETRSWKEGDFIIFDDSFEHEVWHNGTSTRLVLIVDVWHPELTEEEKRTMAAI